MFAAAPEIISAALFLFFFFCCLLGATVTVGHTCSGLGAQVSGSATASDSLEIITSPVSIPAAQPSTLTTRTSATAGTLTMTNSSHGIITGQRIDLYWAGGYASNVTVGTVAGTSVPITLATGTLPAATTAINVGIATQTTFPLTGNNLTVLAMNAPVECIYVFDAGTTDDLTNHMAASDSYVWKSGGINANPLATFAITSVWMSHAQTTAPVTTMQAAALTH